MYYLDNKAFFILSVAMIAYIIAINVICLMSVLMWKKKFFILTIYEDKTKVKVLYITNFLINSIFLTIFFIKYIYTSPQSIDSMFSAITLLGIIIYSNLCFLFAFCLKATFCVFIQEDKIIVRNIFFERCLVINTNTIVYADIIRKKYVINNGRQGIKLLKNKYEGDFDELLNQIISIKSNI